LIPKQAFHFIVTEHHGLKHILGQNLFSLNDLVASRSGMKKYLETIVSCYVIFSLHTETPKVISFGRFF
jgi:hypothetical protein